MSTITDHSLPSPSNHSTVAIACIVFASIHATIKAGLNLLGDDTGYWFDAATYWIPVAQELSNGGALYLTAMDNKTPLWHALNYLVYQTGYYGPVFYLLVGLANAAVAYLLYVWLSRNGHDHAGVIAAGLYLLAIPLMNADIINVRSFSLVFLLAAILDDHPVRRGGAIAVSVLFSQVSAVAVPVLLLDGYRRHADCVGWTVRYLVAGAVTGALPFVALAGVYSPEAMLAGVNASFLGASEYFVEHPDTANPFVHPTLWLSGLARASQKLAFVLLPGVLTAVAVVVSPTWRWSRPLALSTGLAALFFVSVVAKSLLYYWMPVVTFTAVLAGIGLEKWLPEG